MLRLQIHFANLGIGLGCLAMVGCHAAPPPAPPPAVEEDTSPPEEVIPEVVSNEMNLAADDFSGCRMYEEAADKIWSYAVQAELNLSVQIYEGVIVAADAEKLIISLDEFSNGWKSRFAALCASNEKQFLADGQFPEAAQCLSTLLSVQKDYVNGLFHQRQFTLDEAAAVRDHLADCDSVLEPRGEKALKSNPF